MFFKKLPEDLPLTDEMLDGMVPFHDMFPEFKPADVAASEARKVGRPRKKDPAVLLSIRLPKSDLAKAKAMGPGYLTKISGWIHEKLAEMDNGRVL